ncbi:ABC transporter ATP-binding protein [Paenibacillus senegalensis]|uniref:ABC transporter ATP-binding protein n=1 Tax=Paenibacillus senegalensis TaxID=1465766 RepID=UPI00028818A3|nr:ABC transporter ATP-binding protein [Paenibacillus senegalensis]
MEYVVETNRLSKRYGRDYAVNQLMMKVPKGSVYGFLGPNGSGKSSTIRMLLGLVKPTEGTVRIFQEDLKQSRKSILSRVGSLVENPSYYPHLTAHENLEVWRKLVNVPKKRIHEVLELVQLSNVAGKAVKGFSLGMKQRLGIAAALLNEPELLILDEPTNGLDPSGIIEMRNLIKQLASENGMTILVSSHLLAEMDQMATTVGIVRKGQMIFQDSIQALRKLAQNQVSLAVSESKMARHVLLSAGIQADWKEDRLYLADRSDAAVAQAVHTLVMKGHSVYRVEEEKRALETIFLDLIAAGEEAV